MRRIAALLAVALTVGGCGGKGSSETDSAAEQSAETPPAGATTRVEVLKALPAPGGGRTGFDPSTIYRRDAPGVVTVISLELRSTDGDRDGQGLGSGFVISATGEVVTNAHVVTSGTGAAIKPAGKVYVRFADGNQVSARIVGFDPFADVALLRIAPRGLRLRVLPLGTVQGLKVGAPVAAIGSPYGEEQSLSVGVISAVERSIESLTGFATSGAVQTDAAINHGNSGGPLIDGRGEVLGINSQIRTESGEGSGVGFAVPVDSVRRSLEQLRQGGRVRYPYLGVTTAEVYPQLARRFDLGATRGAWIQKLEKDGPAAKAGLDGGGDKRTPFQADGYFTGGDVIVAVNGEPVRRSAELSLLLERRKPRERVVLRIVRDGERRNVSVVLGERPLSAPRVG